MLNKPEISIILPSIRPERLVNFYESFCTSTKRSFEIIVVGPYPLPLELEKYKNIKYARDFGNPTRAQNIALALAEGKFIAWQADDATMLPDAVDQHIDLLISMGEDVNNVVVGKYREGQVNSSDREINHSDNYFKVIGSPAASPYLPAEWWLFNVAFMHKVFLEMLGGFDSNFEGTWSSQTDLAIRAQAAGAKVQMSGIPCMVCDHMPGSSGDHKPIFECQTYHDEPLLKQTYGNPNWPTARSLTVPFFNWKEQETIWGKRFNEV